MLFVDAAGRSHIEYRLMHVYHYLIYLDDQLLFIISYMYSNSNKFYYYYHW